MCDTNIIRVLLVSLVCLLPLRLHAIEINVATGINSDAPFVYGDLEINADSPGITIEILKLIEARTDIKFNIDKRPWARVVKDVKANTLDGGFHFSFKEARRAFVAYPIKDGANTPDPSYSISNRSYVLYRRKGSTVRWNGETIIHDSNKQVDVAAIRGGSITSKLAKLDLKLHDLGTDAQMIKLLLLGRVDCLVGLENMIDAKIDSLPLNQQGLIEKAYPIVVNKPYYIGFSKAFYNKHKEVAWQIWEMIERIRSSGELSEIVKRYASLNAKD